MFAVLATSLPAIAAPIELYPSLSGQSSGDTGEGRWTYFEVLDPVTVTELGIILNPGSSTDRFRWEIHSVQTSGAMIAEVFQTIATYTDDNALTAKDLNVNIPLDRGNYVIGLTTLDAPWQIMMGPNTVSGGYFGPGFVTEDGNLRLWDAGTSSLRDPLQPGNSGGIPGFSLNLLGFTPNPGVVPEPASSALVFMALLGLVATRRCKASISAA